MLPDPQYSPFSWPFYYGFAAWFNPTLAPVPFNELWGVGGGFFLDKRSRPPLLGNGGDVIPKQSDWVYFTSSRRKSYGILADGSLWGWGEGPLGDGTLDGQQVPVRIGTSQWKAVETSDSCTIAIKQDGTLWAWGSNKNGHLGQGSFRDDREKSPRLMLSAAVDRVAMRSDIETFTMDPSQILGSPSFELEKSEPEDPGSGAQFTVDYSWSVAAINFPTSLLQWFADDGAPVSVAVMRQGENEPHPQDIQASIEPVMRYRVASVAFPQGADVAPDVAIVFSGEPVGQAGEASVSRDGGSWVVGSGGLYSSRPTARVVGISSHQPVVTYERFVSGLSLRDGGAYKTHHLAASITNVPGASPSVSSVRFSVLSCDVDPNSRGSGYTSKLSKPLRAYVNVQNVYEYQSRRIPVGDVLLRPAAVSECKPSKYDNIYSYGGRLPASGIYSETYGPSSDQKTFEVRYSDGTVVVPRVRIQNGYYALMIDQDIVDPRGDPPWLVETTLHSLLPLHTYDPITSNVPVWSYISSATTSSLSPELECIYRHNGGSGFVLTWSYSAPDYEGRMNLSLSISSSGQGYTVEPEVILTSKSLSPVQIPGSGWTSVAITETHAVGVKNGEAYEWGSEERSGYTLFQTGSGVPLPENIYTGGDAAYWAAGVLWKKWRPPTKIESRRSSGGFFETNLSYNGQETVGVDEPAVIGAWYDGPGISEWLAQYNASQQISNAPWTVETPTKGEVLRIYDHELVPETMGSVSKVFADRGMIYAIAGGGLWKLDRPAVGPGDHRRILNEQQYASMAVTVRAAVGDLSRTLTWGLQNIPYAVTLSLDGQECQSVSDLGHDKHVFQSHTDGGSASWEDVAEIIPIPIGMWAVVITSTGSGYEDGEITLRLRPNGKLWSRFSPGLDNRDTTQTTISDSSTQTAVTEGLSFQYRINGLEDFWYEATAGYMGGPGPGQPPPVIFFGTQNLYTLYKVTCGTGFRNVERTSYTETEVAESLSLERRARAVPAALDFSAVFGGEYLDIPATAYTLESGKLIDVLHDMPQQLRPPPFYNYTYFLKDCVPDVEIISETGSGATAKLLPVLRPRILPYCLTRFWSNFGQKSVDQATSSHVTSGGELYLTRYLSAPLPEPFQREGFTKLSPGFGLAGGKAYLLRSRDDEPTFGGALDPTYDFNSVSGKNYQRLLPEDVGNIEAVITNPGKKLTMLPRITVQQPPGVAVVEPTLDGRLIGVGVTYGGQWFTSPPQVTVTPIDGQGSGAAATAVISGPVGIVTVTSGGSGYTVPPRVVFSGPGLQATGTAITDGNGHVTSVVISGGGTYRQKPSVSFVPEKIVGQINVDDGGEYYGTPDVLVFGGSGGGAKANCRIDGAVYEIELLSGGFGCFTPPTVVFRSPEGGDTATATATVSEEGVVTAITITNGGSMYQSPPEISFIYHDGSAGGVAAIAKIKGPVSVVNVLDAGRGYDVAPQVRFAGYGMGAAATAVIASPGGGATAEATLNGSVLFCKITAKGSGYQFSPRVTVTATDGNNYKLKLAVDENREPTEAELAAVMPTFDSRIIGPVSSVQVVNAGSSYKDDGPFSPLGYGLQGWRQSDPLEPTTFAEQDEFFASAGYGNGLRAAPSWTSFPSSDTEMTQGWRGKWYFRANGGAIIGSSSVDIAWTVKLLPNGSYDPEDPSFRQVTPYYYQKPVIRFINSMQMNVDRVKLAAFTAASVRKGIEAIKACPGTGFHGDMQGRGVQFTDAKLKSIKDFWTAREFTTRSGIKFKLSDLAFEEPPTFVIVDRTGSGHTVSCSLNGGGKIDGMAIDGSVSSPYSGAAVLKMTAAKLYVGGQSATASRAGSNGLALVSYSGDALYIDPQVVISGSGVGASATAVLEPGKIPRKLRAIVVTARGYGYVIDPTVDVYDAVDFMKSEFAAAINDALAADKTIVEYDYMYPEHVPPLTPDFASTLWRPPLRESPRPYVDAGYFRTYMHAPHPFLFTEAEADKADPTLKDKTLCVLDYYAECESIDDVSWVYGSKAFTGTYSQPPTVTLQGCCESTPMVSTRLASWLDVASACDYSSPPTANVPMRRCRLIRNLSQQEQDTPR